MTSIAEESALDADHNGLNARPQQYGAGHDKLRSIDSNASEGQ
jgi:hypothetical protein